MMFYLLRNEGLFVGPSAALNVTGAVKLARQMGTVPSVFCAVHACSAGLTHRRLPRPRPHHCHGSLRHGSPSYWGVAQYRYRSGACFSS